MIGKVCEALCLDTAGTDGLTSEVSQVVSMAGMNGFQAELIVYAFTATTLSVQLQVSNDGTNWVNKGSAQTVNAIGRHVLTADTSVAAEHVRLHISLTGSGKAILDAWIAVSSQ